MKATRARGLLFAAGLLLIVWGMLPLHTVPAGAAPLLAITETPTSEPPTSTPIPTVPTPGQIPSPTPTTPLQPPPPPPPGTPTSTPPGATTTAAVTVQPSLTPPPSDTPTATPERGDDDGGERERPTRTSTPIGGPPGSPTTTVVPPGPEGTATAVAATATAAAPTTTVTTTISPTPPGGVPQPDPAVSKSVSPPSAVVGDTVVYTILVTNLGGATANGVVVEDTLPGFLSLQGATATRGTVTTAGNSVRVEIGDLAPGETVEVRVTARVNAVAGPPNNRNLATVSSTSPDANPDNNQASVPVDAQGPASLPNTGAGALPLAQTVATILGVAMLAASVLLRRRARR